MRNTRLFASVFAALLALSVGVLPAQVGTRRDAQPASTAAAPAAAPAIPAPDLSKADLRRVVKVLDAQNIVVDIGGEETRVRLLGVVALQEKHHESVVQEHAKRANAFLSNLLQGESVYLVTEAKTRDEYGRLLAHAYRAPDGLWVNLELVRQGLTYVNFEEPCKDLNLFVAYSDRARDSERGLWVSYTLRQLAPAPPKPEAPKPAEPESNPRRTLTVTPPSTAPPPSTPTRELSPEPAKITVYVTRTRSKQHGAVAVTSARVPTHWTPRGSKAELRRVQ